MSAPGLSATPRTTAWCAALGGELNIPVATERLPELRALAAACPPGAPCELDVGRVSEADSAGVQLLLALRRSLAAQGSALRLAGVRGALAQALATYHLDDRLAPLDIDADADADAGAAAAALDGAAP